MRLNTAHNSRKHNRKKKKNNGHNAYELRSENGIYTEIGSMTIPM